MARAKRIPALWVKELVDYDPLTGLLYWKWRERKWFKTDNAWKTWNTRYAKKLAFTATGNHGYRVGALFNKLYLAHHVAFAYMTGRWPDPEVDHGDFDRQNNVWENLKEVTCIQNRRHLRTSVRNKTGVVGVFETRHGFIAQIQVDKRTIYLGTFKSMDAAITKRKSAETEFWGTDAQ